MALGLKTLGGIGRKIKRGLFGDSNVLKSAKEFTGDTAEKAAREAEFVRFKTGEKDVLDNIAQSIEDGVYTPKSREKFFEGKKQLGKDGEQIDWKDTEDFKDKRREYTAENKEDLAKQRKVFNEESMNSWDKENGYVTDKPNNKQKEANKKLQKEREKFRNDLSDDFKNQIDDQIMTDEYNKYVDTFKNKASYHFEEVDITDKGFFNEMSDRILKKGASTPEGVLNHQQKAKYIVDEAGNRRLYDVIDKGVIKTDGTTSLYNKSIGIDPGEFKNRGGLVHKMSKSNRMDRHFAKNAPSTSTSRMINMGVGVGITGGAVLAMSANKGQQTNSQLYGQY